MSGVFVPSPWMLGKMVERAMAACDADVERERARPKSTAELLAEFNARVDAARRAGDAAAERAAREDRAEFAGRVNGSWSKDVAARIAGGQHPKPRDGGITRRRP